METFLEKLARFKVFLESVGGVDNADKLTAAEHFLKHAVFLSCMVVLIIAFMAILKAGLMLAGYKAPPDWFLSFDYIIFPFLAATAWICAIHLNRHLWGKTKT